MTYQWWIGACNELVTENLSPITKTPEYKYCAVNVERIADQRAAEQYVIDEYTKLKASLRERRDGVSPFMYLFCNSLRPEAVFLSIRSLYTVHSVP
ncbi:formate dehydrogenase H (FDH-H) [Citrobacter freundii]|nr:formate dehydrogenase H (FDH-H) [Citrobacter freundii]